MEQKFTTIDKGFITDAYMKKLHSDIVELLKKGKNVKNVSDYGPEVSKYNKNQVGSSFSAKGEEIDGIRHSIHFDIAFYPEKDETVLFIPDKGYFPSKTKGTAKEIVDFIIKKWEGTSASKLFY